MNNFNSELAARERRKKLFPKHSGLKPYYGKRKVHSLRERIPWEYRDHKTKWTDGYSVFILCEPYISIPPETFDLSFIEVPTDLAPYCGRYNPKPGTTPWTRAWLFGELYDGWKLEVIGARLQSAVGRVPRWNEV